MSFDNTEANKAALSSDLEFLVEMKGRFERALTGDWSERDYAFKMMDDWIEELKDKISKC